MRHTIQQPAYVGERDLPNRPGSRLLGVGTADGDRLGDVDLEDGGACRTSPEEVRSRRAADSDDGSRRSRRVPTTSSTIPPTTSFTATIQSVTSDAVCDVSVAMLVGSFRS